MTEKTITENEFFEKYKPLKNPFVINASWDGCELAYTGSELAHVQEAFKKDPNTVWTVIDADGELVVGSGMTFVNRMGYIITEVPVAEGEFVTVIDGDSIDDDEEKSVDDLSGALLNWAIAKALGPQFEDDARSARQAGRAPENWLTWDTGGPLLSQMLEEGLLVEGVDPSYKRLPKFKATADRWETVYRGDTPLEAAFRAYVAKRVGTAVMVPREVLAEFDSSPVHAG